MPLGVTVKRYINQKHQAERLMEEVGQQVHLGHSVGEAVPQEHWVVVEAVPLEHLVEGEVEH